MAGGYSGFQYQKHLWFKKMTVILAHIVDTGPVLQTKTCTDELEPFACIFLCFGQRIIAFLKLNNTRAQRQALSVTAYVVISTYSQQTSFSVNVFK